MSNELIINSTQNGSRIALLNDKNLVEIHYDNKEEQFSVGDIYLGTVRKVMQGLNAAFVDVGYEKDAFLHYHDLGPKINSLLKYTKSATTRNNASYKLSKFKLEPEIDKLGKISQVLARNKQILVQVIKEPISTKGPRLSCELSLPGRYLVLVPFANGISISKKISSSDERKRLTRLISSIKPENFGVIIRTVAEGKEVAELDTDLRNLIETWENGMKKLPTAQPRDKIIGEVGRASSILRDMLNETFDNIHVDDEEIYNEIKSFIHKMDPSKEKILKLYNGKNKIFEHFGIERQLKSLFGQSVNVKGGGYLIIEHTEALHVIDVNSGNKSSTEDNQENTALNTNIEAAKEIARQLRLRDMGGIIVVDFIDMKNPENKKLIFKNMKDFMEDDRSKHTVLPLSKFGLMQITRQRVRPELNIVTQEKCPTCNGSGKITASILISDKLEEDLELLLLKQNEKSISIALHPYLYSYYTKGIISSRVKWFFKYGKWIKLVEDSSLAITEYHFMNSNQELIELN
ncbi:Rne/Rng family ribonuclease [Marivirga sp. S37H4]|uniref:Rne/Rng family ribonuclease n=1 Tax=Marivirga aurantiaca TaxID=2802615 RepID=A0A935CA48_9BACT|nr:Rne/Rng family ribonuclease [Marivirga aurantiaca]MBK6265992.1 Rne/Rng family ribonuclease [Marivirga aurantiaca]